MDRVEFYKSLVRQTICDYAAQIPELEGVDQKIIFHEELSYYALLHNGWLRGHRVYGNILHLEVKDGKIYIQHDGTEDGITDFFLDNGVPTHDIVIQRHPPEYRHLTEFAIS